MLRTIDPSTDPSPDASIRNGYRFTSPAMKIGKTFWPEVTNRPDFTHKRTNHELRRPCERYRAQLSGRNRSRFSLADEEGTLKCIHKRCHFGAAYAIRRSL
jgi:hypothetical protein